MKDAQAKYLWSHCIQGPRLNYPNRMLLNIELAVQTQAKPTPWLQLHLFLQYIVQIHTVQAFETPKVDGWQRVMVARALHTEGHQRCHC